jgi:hypothetical protein
MVKQSKGAIRQTAVIDKGPHNLMQAVTAAEHGEGEYVCCIFDTDVLLPYHILRYELCAGGC